VIGEFISYDLKKDLKKRKHEKLFNDCKHCIVNVVFRHFNELMTVFKQKEAASLLAKRLNVIN